MPQEKFYHLVFFVGFFAYFEMGEKPLGHFCIIFGEGGFCVFVEEKKILNDIFTVFLSILKRDRTVTVS